MKAGATVGAHDATVHVVNHVGTRRADEVRRLREKVAKIRAHLKAAEATLAEAERSQRQSKKGD